MKNFNNVTIFILLLLALTLSSCGGGGDSDSSSEPQSEAKLELIVGDEIKYDVTELSVREGDKVTLTLTHTGELDTSVMGHNFVLLKKGTDVDAFATDAIAAGIESNYIPEGDSVIVSTEVVGGGESTTITFDAPAKGVYTFICSFPGHYVIMQGELTVN